MPIKMVIKSSVMACAVFVTQSPALAADTIVEVMLANSIDDERGYCLDIAGGQGARAPLDKGLQAHTCYHYTGGILEDQGFDLAKIQQGEFVLPYFDRCMTVRSVQAGAAVNLAKCENLATQSFELNASGQIVIQAQPSLCVTVSSTEKKEGRGGSPVHVMRPLSLQACQDSKQPYQTWLLHSL